MSRTLDPEDGGFGVRLFVPDGGDTPGFFGDPFDTSEIGQFLFQRLGQSQQVVYVIGCVSESPGLERADGPVGALEFLVLGYGDVQG